MKYHKVLLLIHYLLSLEGWGRGGNPLFIKILFLSALNEEGFAR